MREYVNPTPWFCVFTKRKGAKKSLKNQKNT